MDITLAERVAFRYVAARGFRAGSALARSWPELIGLVEKDAQAVGQWRRKFVSEGLTALKRAHAEAKASLKGSESSEKWAKQYAADMDRLANTVEKGLKELEKKLDDGEMGPIGGYDVNEIHDYYWDPEMFADGQTKADYGRKPIDPLFEQIGAMAGKLREFWKRFHAKYDLGSLNVTLLGLLPAEMSKRTKVNMELMRKIDSEDLEKSLHWYKGELETLMKEAEKAPGAGSAMSVGVGLSALLGRAKAQGDRWTEDFARALMDQASRSRPFSDRQKAVLEGKLHEYKIPLVNYSIWW